MIASVVFCAAALLILWVLAGYPLWLRHRALTRPRPFARDEATRTVTAIIPVRDGERYLRQKLQSLAAQDYPSAQLEIIVVSDGSTDASEAIAAEFAPRVRLICQL